MDRIAGIHRILVVTSAGYAFSMVEMENFSEYYSVDGIEYHPLHSPVTAGMMQESSWKFINAALEHLWSRNSRHSRFWFKNSINSINRIIK